MEIKFIIHRMWTIVFDNNRNCKQNERNTYVQYERKREKYQHIMKAPNCAYRLKQVQVERFRSCLLKCGEYPLSEKVSFASEFSFLIFTYSEKSVLVNDDYFS